MEKRVLFQSAWLPWVLLAPQMAVIAGLFLLAGRPGAAARRSSCRTPSASPPSGSGLDNFRRLFADPAYLESFKITAFFSVLVAVVGIGVSLLLAVFADRVVRGAMFYKTFLIVPYAVAPAVAGVLWLFMFSPTLGIVALRPGPSWASTGTTCSIPTMRWR